MVIKVNKIKKYGRHYTICRCGNKKRILSRQCKICYCGPRKHKAIKTPSYIRPTNLKMKGGIYGTKTNT